MVSPILCIWIDQICINQSDLEERNSQVMLMRRIYKQSRLCSVWFGGDDQFSQTAITIMTRMMDISVEKFPKFAFKDKLDTRSYDGLGIEPIGPWEWIALYAFLSRSWFWRSWVVQEAVLSREVSFCCGLTTFSLGNLDHIISLLGEGECVTFMNQLAQALQGHSNTCAADARIMKEQDPGAPFYQPNPDGRPNCWMLGHLFDIRRMVFGFHSSTSHPQKPWRSDQQGLSRVLYMFKSMKATDPKDKVYAFLGLAEELGQLGTLHPVYEKPLAEVFRDTMKFMLQSSNSLNGLVLKEDPQRTKTLGLKSWVPDFTSNGLGLPRHFPPLSLWSTEKCPGGTHFMFRPGGVLEVRGLRIGTACAVHELIDLTGPGLEDGPGSFISVVQALPEYSSVWIPSLTPTLRSYLEINSFIPNKEFYDQIIIEERGTVALQSRLEVFWRTLVVDCFGKEFPPPKSTVDLFLRFWDRDLQERMVVAGLPGLVSLKPPRISRMWRRFGDSPSWDVIRPSISAIYRAQMILQGQHSDEVQNEPFPEEMSAILRELDAAWAEDRLSDEGIAMAQRVMKDLEREVSAEALEFFRMAKLHFTQKHLFAKNERQLGIGPKSTRVGDEIWNLVGADAPFVLRPQGDGRYALVGGAYVHGAMFAEWHEGAQMLLPRT